MEFVRNEFRRIFVCHLSRVASPHFIHECVCLRAIRRGPVGIHWAGVNSLPSSPLPIRSLPAPLGSTLKSTPLAAHPISLALFPPSLPSSSSALHVFSDHRRCRLQRQHSAAGQGWPPPLRENGRAEDSDAQARVTDRSPADKERFFFYRPLLFSFFLPRYPARDITSALSLLIGRRAGRKPRGCCVAAVVRARVEETSPRRDCFHGELGGSVTRLSSSVFPNRYIYIYTRE